MKTTRQILDDIDYEIAHQKNIIQILLTAFRNMEGDSETPNQVITLLEVLKSNNQKIFDQTMKLWDLIGG